MGEFPVDLLINHTLLIALQIQHPCLIELGHSKEIPLFYKARAQKMVTGRRVLTRALAFDPLHSVLHQFGSRLQVKLVFDTRPVRLDGLDRQV